MVNYEEDMYLDAIRYVIDKGDDIADRTGTGTKSVFGYQFRYDIRNKFPAITTKKLAWKGVVSELLWFLEGSTDERRLAEILYEDSRDNLIGKKTIWTANADAQGKSLGYTNTDTVKELGPVYGAQWRNFNGVDQIEKVISQLKTDPNSRRIILSAWNPKEIDNMALPPCHSICQFNIVNGKLSCQLYQRSLDLGLGASFNIASYSLLIYVIAQICSLQPGEFIHTVGNMHVYNDHIPGLEEQLKRNTFPFPTLKLPKFSSLEEVLSTKPSDYILEDYKYHPPIKMKMSV